MEKLDLHYKLTKLKWQIKTLLKRLYFRSFLFRCRIKRILKRKDVESTYPHTYYHNLDSYKIGIHDYMKKPDLNLGGFKPEELTMIYGRLIK